MIHQTVARVCQYLQQPAVVVSPHCSKAGQLNSNMWLKSDIKCIQVAEVILGLWM